MTSGEKALYHSIIEQLKDKELSDSQKDNFVKKLDELFKSISDCLQPLSQQSTECR